MSFFHQLLRRLGAHDGMTTINTGNPAPNFSLKSLDGKEFSLSKSLRNGPVVLAFFKVSCPVCKFAFPFLERLFQRYGKGRVSGAVLTAPESEHVTFLAVSQDDVSASRKFAEEFGLTFPILSDSSGYPVSNAYGLSMVPTVFLIDSSGTVLVSSMGFVKADLESIADSLADRENINHVPVFLSTESVPAVKPG
jgi:peroxiredoxin